MLKSVIELKNNFTHKSTYKTKKKKQKKEILIQTLLISNTSQK